MLLETFVENYFSALWHCVERLSTYNPTPYTLLSRHLTGTPVCPAYPIASMLTEGDALSSDGAQIVQRLTKELLGEHCEWLRMQIRQSPSQQPSSVVFDAQTCERYSPHILGWICWPRHPKRRRLHLQELNAGSKICFNAFNPRVQRSENHRGPMRNRRGSRCLCSKDISKRSWG